MGGNVGRGPQRAIGKPHLLDSSAGEVIDHADRVGRCADLDQQIIAASVQRQVPGIQARADVQHVDAGHCGVELVD